VSAEKSGCPRHEWAGLACERHMMLMMGLRDASNKWHLSRFQKTTYLAKLNQICPMM
jgi:hypothetical protein